MTTDVSSIQQPFQAILLGGGGEVESLHGDLNSEEVTMSCHIERVLIYLQYKKNIWGKRRKERLGWVPASEVGVSFAVCIRG